MDVRHLEPGQTIDGFLLEAPLKPGGMANLWRVSHPDHDLPLVMKLPFVQPGENPIAIIGFEVEGMILPRLTGEHAPRFIKAGDFSHPYVVMEFIAGTSLKARLDKTPLPADEVAAIGAHIAIALHGLHSQHVIHLDLKPSNVIMRETGEAALIGGGGGGGALCSRRPCATTPTPPSLAKRRSRDLSARDPTSRPNRCEAI